MRWLVPLTAALVPLIITPGLLSYFDVTPKIAILLLAVPLIFLYRKENTYNCLVFARSRAGRWFAGLLAAMWIAAAIATVRSAHPELSAYGGNWRRFGLASETGLLLFVLAAAAWLAADSGHVRRLLRACTVSGACSALYGIAQYAGWDPLLPRQGYQAGEGEFMIVRPPGTLGHADYFAAYLVMIVFLALALRKLETGRWRHIAVATAGLASVAILLSGTRSALLGLLAGAILLWILARPRIGLRGAGVAMASLAILAAFYFSPAGARLRARVHWSIDDARGGARLLLWRDSARMAAQRPVAGYGPETFATEFARFESIDLARAYPDFYHESPHNMFLDAWTSRGILGLLALLGICALACWAMASGIRANQIWMTPLAGGLAGILVCQQFVVFTVPTALYFFLLASLPIAALARSGETADRPALPRWPVTTALVVSLWPAFFAIRLLMADGALAAAYRHIQSGDVAGASRAYTNVLRWQPPGAGSDLAYSRALTQLAASTQNFATRVTAQQHALDAGIRAAVTAEDRHNAWYNLAVLFSMANNPEGVERALRNAIAWAPNWYKPHWALARYLDLANHPKEALAEASAAMERNGGKDPEVTETWRALLRKNNVTP